MSFEKILTDGLEKSVALYDVYLSTLVDEFVKTCKEEADSSVKWSLSERLDLLADEISYYSELRINTLISLYASDGFPDPVVLPHSETEADMSVQSKIDELNYDLSGYWLWIGQPEFIQGEPNPVTGLFNVSGYIAYFSTSLERDYFIEHNLYSDGYVFKEVTPDTAREYFLGFTTDFYIYHLHMVKHCSMKYSSSTYKWLPLSS